MEKNHLSRRQFVKNTSLGAIGLSLSAKSYSRILGANERVQMAHIGLNGRGQAHIAAVLNVSKAETIAFCDVDIRTFDGSQQRLARSKAGPVKTYRDFRLLLENKDIDAITIATPDHWHTPMAIQGMQAGKHVYVEKPPAYNPQEAEWLVAAQQKTGMVVQVGNQQRSAPTSIEAMQDIADGIIGNVYFGKAWYANTRGSIGHGKQVPVPEWLDWDLWQGPAPRREYQDNLVHYNWHWFWHWGTGEINNNGLHEMDICRWALGVDFPTKVTSSGGRYQYEDDWQFYDTQVASFEFGKDKMLTWEGLSCNGLKQYDRDRGASLQGTEGSIILDRNAYQAFDKGGKLIKQVNERSLSATTDTTGIGGLDVYHMQNFIDGIRVGAKLNSPVTEGQKSVMLCHLGNIAQKFNRTLQTDARNGKILNDAEAMTLWSREYEDGWKPAV